MTEHRMMMFRLGQQMTQDNAIRIGQFYELPASVIDEIERKSPSITLIRALEQRLIICQDVHKLRAFHGTLVMMNYLDLAKIIEDVYPQFKQAATPTQPSSSSSTRDGGATEEGRVVVPPSSMQYQNS